MIDRSSRRAAGTAALAVFRLALARAFSSRPVSIIARCAPRQHCRLRSRRAACVLSFGVHGETVEGTADFEGAFCCSQDSGRPALIGLRFAPQARSPPDVISEALQQQSDVSSQPWPSLSSR